MIQRKQTLFLMQIAFLALSLLFVPVQFIGGPTALGAKLLPLSGASFSSTSMHMAAIALNFAGLILASATIFIFRKRNLQVNLCYVLMIIYSAVLALIAFTPFIQSDGIPQKTEINLFGYIIPVVNIVSAYFASRFVKKDIALLKSSERIR